MSLSQLNTQIELITIFKYTYIYLYIHACVAHCCRFTGHSNGSIQLWDLTTALELKPTDQDLGGPSACEFVKLLDKCDLASISGYSSPTNCTISPCASLNLQANAGGPSAGNASSGGNNNNNNINNHSSNKMNTSNSTKNLLLNTALGNLAHQQQHQHQYSASSHENENVVGAVGSSGGSSSSSSSH